MNKLWKLKVFSTGGCKQRAKCARSWCNSVGVTFEGGTELLTERLLASAADLRVHRGGFPAGRLLHPGQVVPGEDPPAAAGGEHAHTLFTVLVCTAILDNFSTVIMLHFALCCIL